MNITSGWLKDRDACSPAVTLFRQQEERDATKLVRILMDGDPLLDREDVSKNKSLAWANWLIVRIMTRRQRVQYAVYAAEHVVALFEAQYPKDDRPRKAIDAAKDWVRIQSSATSRVAESAAWAAESAARAADRAADSAAYSAASAAYSATSRVAESAAWAAESAARAAESAAWVAESAARAAESAARAADRESTQMQSRILEYGLLLLAE